MNTTHRWCVAAFCACLGSSAIAGDLTLPAVQSEGEISFVTGGVGMDDADAFRAAAHHYNLRITFASLSGEYYAGVRLTLRDAQGKTVIETTSDGPFVFFNVRPGKYVVTAENLGQKVTRVTQVREKRGTELYIRWKSPSEAQTQ